MVCARSLECYNSAAVHHSTEHLMQTFGVLFHPKIPKTADIAHELRTRLEQQSVQCWIASAWDEVAISARLDVTQMLVTLGGDGTILRTARLTADSGIP